MAAKFVRPYDPGVVYIAIGQNAAEQAALSRKNLFFPFVVIAGYEEVGLASRWAKVNLFNETAYSHTAYLDADTRIFDKLDPGFEVLMDGWDLVIVPSSKQGRETLWHLSEEERRETFRQIGFKPLQLQGGVFFFARNDRVEKFFEILKEEWLRYKEFDQGAILRALYRHPLKVWLFGSPWNSSNGTVIQHRFGSAR